MKNPNKIYDGVIVFAYHSIGVKCLNILIRNRVKIHLVVTHHDSDNENIWFKSVEETCKNNTIKYLIIERSNFDNLKKKICNKSISVIFSFYFRKIIPNSILELSKYGAVNMHGSLLPKYRGRAPINWHIVNGEKKGGITLHYMNEKPDSGNIIDQKSVSISKTDTPIELFEKVEKAGEMILSRSLESILNGTCPSVPQDHKIATYYGSRKPKDGRIDWNQSSEKILNLIRGVTKPYPGAYTYINKKKIIIWKAASTKFRNSLEEPGKVIINRNYVYVKTGDGLIRLSKIQIDGHELSPINKVELIRNYLKCD